MFVHWNLPLRNPKRNRIHFAACRMAKRKPQKQTLFAPSHSFVRWVVSNETKTCTGAHEIGLRNSLKLGVVSLFCWWRKISRDMQILHCFFARNQSKNHVSLCGSAVQCSWLPNRLFPATVSPKRKTSELKTKPLGLVPLNAKKIESIVAVAAQLVLI